TLSSSNRARVPAERLCGAWKKVTRGCSMDGLLTKSWWRVSAMPRGGGRGDRGDVAAAGAAPAEGKREPRGQQGTSRLPGRVGRWRIGPRQPVLAVQQQAVQVQRAIGHRGALQELVHLALLYAATASPTHQG